MTAELSNLRYNRTQNRLLHVMRLFCVLALAFTLAACSESGGSGSSGGSLPSSTTPLPSATDQEIFEATLRPLLIDPGNGCIACHGDLIEQDPKFASANATTAYNIVISQQKVNLINPEISRLYLRPHDDRHNCGGAANCDRIAADFLAAIENWATQAAASGPPSGNTLVASTVVGPWV